MSIPKDGYYICRLMQDTGGDVTRYVRVLGGAPYLPGGHAVLPSACSHFRPVESWEFCGTWPDLAAAELDTLRAANKALVEQCRAIQSELNKSARILLETVNDRNRIGTQLDLIRDELKRIESRIAETGLIGEHPELGSIAGYCQRGQNDIAVMYAPIEERDKLGQELTTALCNNADLTERVKWLEEAGDELARHASDQARDDWSQAKETKP